MKNERRIGEILVAKGLITFDDLSISLQEQQRTKEFLGTILVKKSIIKEKDLMGALSEQFGMPLISLKDKYIHWSLVKDLSAELVFEHKCFPISKDDWSITFALINPLDMWARKNAETAAGTLRAKFVLVTESDMTDVISRYRQVQRSNITKMFNGGS